MNVYHIVRNNSGFTKGDLIQPVKYKYDSFSPKKRQVEGCLEEVRQEFFPYYPSRLNCLFVCHSFENIEVWAFMKYGLISEEFEILSLNTTKPIFWFSAKSYNEYFCGLKTDLNQACLEYWKSRRDDNLEKVEDCEGITNGAAIVVEICHASITRGLGLELINNKYNYENYG